MPEAKSTGSNNVVKKNFLKKYLEEKRCAMTREFVEALGMDRSTLLNLLHVLEREGAVERRKVGRMVLWCLVKRP
jgi:DNA-binding IclR family transcriptional regulator